MLAAVKPGRRMARFARPSYQSSMAWNFSLNLRSKRGKKPTFSAFFSSCFRLMKLAQKSGTTVIAKKYDAKIESTTPKARGENIHLLIPERNVTGKKTIEVVEVAARTARDTSMPPFSAATLGGSPISMKRKIFSSTTTESSINREKA